MTSVYCAVCSKDHEKVGDLDLNREVDLPTEIAENGKSVFIKRKFYHAVCPERGQAITLIVDVFSGGFIGKELTIVRGEI